VGTVSAGRGTRDERARREVPQATPARWLTLMLCVVATGWLHAQQPGSQAGASGYPAAEGVAARPPAVDVAPVFARPAIDTLATVRRRGRLRVGVAPSTPWVMRDKEGELIGFSVDLAKKLADDMGVSLEIVPTSWPHIIDDLLDNHFDVIASGLWITPSRALLVNYSQPTSLGAVSLIAGRARAGTFTDAADFNKPGVTIAVNGGTEMEEVAARRFPQATLLKVDIADDPLAPVLEGKAHGAVLMSPVARLTVGASGGALFQPSGSELVTASTALAVRKGDPDFLSFLNAWLTYHRETGWTLERYDYWFQSTAWLALL
jgi:polar amino acid transport system substrate-binding protein